MTNDTSTEAGCMQEAVDKLEANLAAMGVTASYSRVDGYYALLDEILNINKGILIDTNVSIIPDKYSVHQGESVTVNGVLGATFDGTVDMTGFLEGASVKLYDGNTLIDTVTTDSTGAFTKTFTLSNYGQHSLKAVFEGITDEFDDCESSAVVVYCTNTVITLNVPMSLIYSDAFNLTGVLKDTSDNTLSGKTVSLLVGGTCVDTDTTDNNGEFSFTQTPVHMGTHSFQISWEGDVTYYPTVSSIVTREIGKETSVLNVSSPTTNQNVYSDGSLSVAGTLQSNDAEAISNASVLVKQNGSTLTTLTTDSNGAFTGSVNASNLDTGDIDIIFESNSTHTASSASIAIVVNDPTLTLVSDKSILSYVNNDVATLTATYTGANPSGKVVSFDIVDENGDVIENIDSATTDSNGVCSVYYLSNGADTIYIQASNGMFLSETYTIEDCHFYNDLTTNASDSKFTIGSNATVTHDSKGMKIYCGVNGKGNEDESNHVVLNESLPSGDWEVSFTFTDGNQYDMLTNIDGLNFDRTDSTGSTQILLWKITNHDWNTLYDPSIYISVAKNDVIKVQKQNNVFSIYVNDTLATTINYDSTYATGKFLMASCCGTRWTQSKNLKIKSL